MSADPPPTDMQPVSPAPARASTSTPATRCPPRRPVRIRTAATWAPPLLTSRARPPVVTNATPARQDTAPHSRAATASREPQPD
ncbi:hypothetical protein [Kitasatospora sp. CMC57]|uniref:hypothetical protein n=1 Tax=Kitasatospora sp. CMC57 TaxID=3231513 RepID=UPI0038B5CED3